MSVLKSLTLRHIFSNKKRSAITVIGIILSVAMVTAVSGMVVSFQDLLYRDSVATEGLWHVRYSDVSADLVKQVAAEPVFSQWELIETEDGPVLSLLFSRLHKGIFDESEEVCRKYGIEATQVRYHNNLLIARGIVPGPYYTALYSFAAILMALIGIGSVLVISNAFTISSDQRSLQFGLLKSAGATREQIRGMVLFEGAVLTLVAIPMGMLVGLFAQWVALSIANAILEPMMVNISVPFRVIVSPGALAVTVVATSITVFLAAWFPAQKASKISAVEAIRQTKAVKIAAKQVRVFPLTGKVFGFEGVLAAKSIGRSRGKYRSTILALVVSIVLFIGVSSFGNILIKATSMVYEGMGSNVVVSMSGEHLDALYTEMSSWDGVQAYPSRNIDGISTLSKETLSKEYQQYFGGETPPVQLFGIGDDAFGQLCKDLRISGEMLSDSGEIPGILVNTSGTYIQQGRRINFIPFHLSAGDSFPISINEQEYPLTITGTIQEVLPGIFFDFSADTVNVIVPDGVIRDLWPPEKEDFLWIAVMADDPEAFEEQARALLEQELPFHTFSVIDYDKMAANNRNIAVLVMIFVYGFIAMLTLIGITSVIATISTNIALRTREFAMLRSVGMTESSIAKMLNYESLLYGIKALLWGIPLGLVTCILLYKSMTSVMDFPFIWPVDSILISIVAILLITFVTMSFARRKQRQVNIVNALRNDII